jgi:hypothetical protein
MKPTDPWTDATSQESMAAADAAFARSLQALLRKGENDLDFVTASRLSAARARAVAQAGSGGLRWPWAAAVPTACAAVLAAWIVIPGMLGARTPHRAPIGAVPVEVLEQLGSDETPVVDEELDFAQWLEQQPAVAPDATGNST